MQRHLKERTKRVVRKDAAIMMSAVTQTLVDEILFESGINTTRRKAKIIQPRDILFALNNNEDLAIIRSKLKPMLAGAGIIPTEDMFNLGTKPGSPKSLVPPSEGGNNEVFKQFSTVPPRPASDDDDESDGEEEDDEIHQQPPPSRGAAGRKKQLLMRKYNPNLSTIHEASD
ncbi:uncharacterized protein LOC142356251 isoform X2 [Convolutriloba macropyga]|uniref:uncharacterized protein LOC142356251 isoform X2 n=1 Tax=Convolutriloba macropyga TaxID=536237 RepID=UPI003F5205C6